MNPEPRGWIVEIDAERWLCCRNNRIVEVDDAIEATLFVTDTAANLAAYSHLGDEELHRARIAPLY